MVTFNTEYWAPALDSRSRRRRTNSEERAARVTKERISTIATSTSKKNKELPVVDITDPNKSPFNNDYNGSSNSNSNSNLSTLTAEEVHPLIASNRTNSNTPSTNDAVNTSSIYSNLSIDATNAAIPIVPNSKVDGSLNSPKISKDFLHHHDSHKRMSFVQKLFHHESKDHLVTSPAEEKGEFVFSNGTPDKFSTLKEILNPTLDLDSHKQMHGSDSGSDSELIDSESLIKKYGVCEKGCIGKGATAVVRLAHKLDKSDCETTFAVKEFRKKRKNESEKEYVKKLASEFCISSALQHINIVRTVDLVQDENHNWCEVMEYCAGGDLYTAIKSNHMTPVEINCCFKQLIMGVDYLHDMGVAHRDIKPENLLLDVKGHLKITDFGVSDVFRTCWQEAAHKSKGLCGSEPYISPEQFETSEYDARLVDVWACGIVYYTMVYQGMPFRMATPTDPNYASYLETRNSREYEPFEKLPYGCRELMYKILEPDAKKRITTSKIKQDSWFQSIESCSDTSPIKLKQSHHHISPELLKEIQNGNATMGTKLVNNRMNGDVLQAIPDQVISRFDRLSLKNGENNSKK